MTVAGQLGRHACSTPGNQYRRHALHVTVYHHVITPCGLGLLSAMAYVLIFFGKFVTPCRLVG